MKKHLLLSLFAIFSLAGNAQETVVDYTQTMPLQQPSTLNGFFAPHKSISAKADVAGPTAYYSRPEGLMFFGMSYRGLQARHHGFAPQGVDIVYRGVATGDKAIWNYELEYNSDGTPLNPLTKDFTAEDPTLTITYEDGGYYAPELCATVGTGETAKDSAYSIVLSRIWTRSSTGEIFGSGDEMYDIPVGNYNGRYFGFLDNSIYSYAATNNEDSDKRIAEGFELQAAHVGGFYEYMPLMNGVSYALYGADAIIYAETKPELSDIEIEVYETMDGEIIDPEAPLTVMRAAAINPLNYTNNTLMGYGIRFAAPQAITANGEIMLHFVNAPESTLSFSPCLAVTNDPDTKCYAKCDFEYTISGAEKDVLFPMDFMQYNGGYHVTGLATGLIMSYHPFDVEEIQNGIGTITSERSNANYDIFDIQGRKTSAKGHGVFIKNGKKFIR